MVVVCLRQVEEMVPVIQQMNVVTGEEMRVENVLEVMESVAYVSVSIYRV